MGHDAHDISATIRTFMKVGITLVIFTVITVAISFIDFGGNNNMIVGMAVATFKAALVALIFMHLGSEKPMIYKFLVFTTAFAIVLFVLFIMSSDDQLVDEHFEAPMKKAVPTAAHH
jgi:caa(3)-type oxidase subunit IV